MADLYDDDVSTYYSQVVDDEIVKAIIHDSGFSDLERTELWVEAGIILSWIHFIKEEPEAAKRMLSTIRFSVKVSHFYPLKHVAYIKDFTLISHPQNDDICMIGLKRKKD